MTLTLELQPEIECGLLAQAEARGVSLADYALDVLAREAQAARPPTGPGARNLVELFANSPFKGLDIEFERDKDYGREVEL